MINQIKLKCRLRVQNRPNSIWWKSALQHKIKHKFIVINVFSGLSTVHQKKKKKINMNIFLVPSLSSICQIGCLFGAKLSLLHQMGSQLQYEHYIQRVIHSAERGFCSMWIVCFSLLSWQLFVGLTIGLVVVGYVWYPLTWGVISWNISTLMLCTFNNISN